MNRRHFLAAMGVAGAAAWAGRTPAQAEEAVASVAPAAPIEAVDGTPVVYAPTASGATVVWTLKAPARGWVEYGESRQLGRVFRSTGDGFVPHGERVIRARLRGLQPGRRYWWRGVTVPLAGGEPEVSPVYSFRTLDPVAAETRFAVWNDTHDRAETLRKLHEATRAEPADFLVWNGDVSNNIEKPEVIPGLYVHPREADLAECPPVVFSRGNHDVRGLWANRVSEFVDFPGGRPFYAFRSGPLAAIVLDTGEDKPDGHPSFRGLAAFEPLIAEQKRWLARVTQRPEIKSAPFRLVFCHIPLRWTDEKAVDYDKGGFDWFSRRGREAWQPTLARWGAQAVVSGHMHRWACLPATSEFPYEQIVGGGPKPDSATLIRGSVTERELKLAIRDLDGRVLHESTYSPREA